VPVLPTGSVSGHVTTPGGQPATRAGVLFLRPGSLEPAAFTNTGEGGAFSLADLPAGEYLISAAVPGLAPLRRQVALRAGEKVTLDFELSAGVTLRGRVAGQRPRDLFVSAESDRSFGGVRVANDGTFAIPHLLPGAYALRLWAPGEARITTVPGAVVGDAKGDGVRARW